jgi:hypothetical protein
MEMADMPQAHTASSFGESPMRYIGKFPSFVLALLHFSHRLFLAMSFPRESFKPFYDTSTASDDWRRGSEWFGMERDRQELRERCGMGYVYVVPEPKEIHARWQSYEEFWAETVTDRETWWSKWKKEHGF